MCVITHSLKQQFMRNSRTLMFFWGDFHIYIFGYGTSMLSWAAFSTGHRMQLEVPDISLGMFLLRSGLRFSFGALEVPEPRVRKMPLLLLIWPFPHSRFESEGKALLVGESGIFLTLGSRTSSAPNENLRPLFNANIPLISRHTPN